MGVAPWGMSSLCIEVDAQVENLQGLKSDLEEHYWSQAANDPVRYALGIAIGQMAQRIAALEEVIRHHGGERIAATSLTLEEARDVERALDVLDGEFVPEPEARQSRLWTRVRAMLTAADVVLLLAARGQLASDHGIETGPRPGVVLPLARTR